ncbi:Mu transposase C-terminal domain-containing protein [Neorhizobium sp. T786]|uniref:transposase domain-containing protein n=1 Tax=Pseudorhizobium xiangyangii TaxID=2883104 RepID=UPI001CFFC8F0|nr:transposase domain-containing protein [Neorhizobium xiangyangii]MCB5204219.1 Mu transposase C-terminal domain-containing protein [Neorhizobium xiangyangii]
MKEWFTSQELAEAKLPGLAHTRQGIENFVQQSGVRSTEKARPREGRGGGFEYHYSFLPSVARQKIAFMNTPMPAADTKASKSLWARFEALSTEHKTICQKRLDTLVAVDDMRASGISIGMAVQHCARLAAISVRTLYEWRLMVEGHARHDWLAALAPSFSPTINGVVVDRADCHPQAWEVLKSDYLRPEQPKFSACYRRMMSAATINKWSPIPSERSLRRRLDSEVPKAAQVLARDGREKAARLFPAQTRSVVHLHAMQIVNTDGHKLDLRVNAPWSAEPTRVLLIGIQDIYSRKILSWRLAESETWEVVRACIGDMIENEGGKLPEHFYMDNGRAFASKKISGGATRRNRFKITGDEVAGLLKTLGIEAHFTKPYSGQSKPIERAWKDLAEEISRHPAMSGCYTGANALAKPENYGKRAIPLDELQEHVSRCVAEHNSREGRRTEAAKGRSFNQVFDASVAEPSTIIRYASHSQRSLWLLTAETLKARKPDGSLHHLGNRYWAPVLNQWIGKKLTMRFDPADLHAPVKVYDPAGRFLCDAECISHAGFDSTGDAKRKAKTQAEFHKTNKKLLELNRTLEASELGKIYADANRAEQRKRKPEPPVRPVVTRLITGNLAKAVPIEADEDNNFDTNFSRGFARMVGDDSAIIPFPTGNTGAAGIASARKSRAEK